MTLSDCAGIVRVRDPDRFLCTLFAPAERRESLFVLCAFDQELARAREVASNPLIAAMRLQWWREVVEGADKRHEVATPLRAEMAAGRLRAGDLLAMIDAREVEAEPDIPTRDAWWAYLRGTGGTLAHASGVVLGMEDARFADIGAAVEAARVLRAVPVHARHGRCLLPADALAAQDLSPEAVIGAVAPDRLLRVVADLAAEALSVLGAPRRVPRRGRAAALPAVLARRDLRRFAHGLPPRPRGTADRLAVMVAVWSGRM